MIKKKILLREKICRRERGRANSAKNDLYMSHPHTSLRLIVYVFLLKPACGLAQYNNGTKCIAQLCPLLSLPSLSTFFVHAITLNSSSHIWFLCIFSPKLRHLSSLSSKFKSLVRRIRISKCTY